MSEIQHLILEDGDNTYDVLVESAVPFSPSSPPEDEDGYEDYGPGGPPRGLQGGGQIKGGWGGSTGSTVPEETRVQLQKVHKTIQGYTQYAIGAFKNLAIAEVEEINLKFNLKISAEGGMPMLASAKTEADFAIEVKCKFSDNKAED